MSNRQSAGRDLEAQTGPGVDPRQPARLECRHGCIGSTQPLPDPGIAPRVVSPPPPKEDGPDAPVPVPPVSTSQKVTGAMSWTLIPRVVQMAVSLLTSILIVRTLGEFDYGTLSVLRSLLIFAVVVLGLGLGQAINRFIPELRVTDRRREGRGLLYRCLLLQSALWVVACLVLLAPARCPAGALPHLRRPARARRLPLAGGGGRRDGDPVRHRLLSHAGDGAGHRAWARWFWAAARPSCCTSACACRACSSRRPPGSRPRRWRSACCSGAAASAAVERRASRLAGPGTAPSRRPDGTRRWAAWPSRGSGSSATRCRGCRTSSCSSSSGGSRRRSCSGSFAAARRPASSISPTSCRCWSWSSSRAPSTRWSWPVSPRRPRWRAGG